MLQSENYLLIPVPDKEATILEEMKIIKHAKKVPKRESSFHAEQPRRAAVKQKEKMKVLAAKQSKPSASETSLKKVSVIIKVHYPLWFE